MDSDAEFAVIFEDDVFFDPTKLRAVIGELTQNKSYWDIVNFDINHGGAPLTIKTLKHKHLLSVYLTEVAHSGSYMLSRKAALKLLEKALPIKMPVDHYFTRSWEFGLVFAGVENPRLVRQQYGDSDIKARELITPNNASLMFFIKKSIYKVQSGVIRFLYNISVFADLLIKDKE